VAKKIRAVATRNPLWARKLEKQLGSVSPGRGSSATRKSHAHFQALRKGLKVIADHPIAPHPLALPGQPLDTHLLSISPLFKKSRQAYLETGGDFEAALISSPRSLSSVSLVQAKIQYSPIHDELLWAGTDARQKNDPQHLMMLITFTTSLFHEQNHRILWRLLPPPPEADKGALRRYLNFAESLVITLDMALGDELGPKLASLFYFSGATYDPGTTVKFDIGPSTAKNKRVYRNYLQAALHATYLNLELYNAENIENGIHSLFPTLGALAARAAKRSANLDPMFINLTNPEWQNLHWKTVIRALHDLHASSGPSRESSQTAMPSPVLLIPDHPLENHFQYLYAEKMFDLLGL
jgi:hypothetical protein